MSFVDTKTSRKEFNKSHRAITKEDIKPGNKIVFARDVGKLANDPQDEIHIFGPFVFVDPAIIDGVAHYEKDRESFQCSVEDILKGETSDGILYRCPR